MAVAVNEFHAAKSPLEAVSGALSLVSSLYGMKHASAANDLVQQQIEKGKAEAALAASQLDPNSPAAKAAQESQAIFLQAAADRGYANKDDVKNLISSIRGTPAVPGQTINGAPLANGLEKIEDTGTPAKPGMSISALKQALPEEGGLVGFIKGQQAADAAQMKLAGLVGTKKDANQMRANSAYDAVIGKKYEDRLDAAGRVKALIDAARNDTLIPSENLASQLATDINVLQAGHSSVSGTEHSRPNTLFGKGGTFAHFVSGDPQAAITKADLNQMFKETDLLYNEIGDQAQKKFGSWVKGQPSDVQPALMERFADSRSQYFPSGSRSQASAGGSGAAPTKQNGGDDLISSANASDAPTVDHVSAAKAEIARRAAAKAKK